MLERFKVPQVDQVKVSSESLKITVTQIFEKMGVNHEDSLLGADVLVTTDLRGVETHGVSNMMRKYTEMYNKKELNPKPSWKITREAPATANIDADKGLAVILGPKAMKIAIEKAKNVGVGIVTMHNSGHSGAIGYHAMLAAEENMIGMCMTAGGRAVLPTFGSEPLLGTNPIAFAAPAKKEPFLLFDAATSAIAGNKVELASRVNAKLLPGWISDANGAPINTEEDVPNKGDYFLLPVGGTRELGSHKGFGFSMISETMTALLSGVMSSMLDPESKAGNHCFIAYDISAFTDLETFKNNMDKMLITLRDSKPAPGHKQVYYPGLLEHQEIIKRLSEGIPLHKEVVEWFDNITTELNIPNLKKV